MNKIYFFIFYFISISILAQDEVSADWSVSIDGDEVTISIVEFNNFTVGLDGHWHYILNDEDYVAVHDINDVILSNLPDGDHSLFIWLVDHMHNALNPPVEEIIEFSINTGLSNSENETLDMMIYPNPVDGNYVTILSPVKGLKEIEVYSVTGRKVMDTAINGSTLDVSSLNTGFYLLKVTINGQNKVSKLVVR
tara:strand:+ start:1534 stop:2115 length:582 start_codon:yes stop_codon:yes gene_type:complete